MDIFRDEIAVQVLGIRSVGVRGDERTYSEAIALRAVDSADGMTSDWYKIPYEVLGAASSRIVKIVK